LEVFDNVNKSHRFLGLGIVGVEELLANPSQRQIIPLQARPYEEDDITGTLTVEVIPPVLYQFVSNNSTTFTTITDVFRLNLAVVVECRWKNLLIDALFFKTRFFSRMLTFIFIQYFGVFEYVNRGIACSMINRFVPFLYILQFLFIEGAEVPQIGTKPYKVKETIKPVSPTRSYSQSNVISSNSLNYNNGNSTLILYDSAAQSEGGNYRLLIRR